MRLATFLFPSILFFFFYGFSEHPLDPFPLPLTRHPSLQTPVSTLLGSLEPPFSLILFFRPVMDEDHFLDVSKFFFFFFSGDAEMIPDALLKSVLLSSSLCFES